MLLVVVTVNSREHFAIVVNVQFCCSSFTGQIIVASLLSRNIKVRLLVRNPEKATKLFGELDEEKMQVIIYICGQCKRL